MAKSNREHFMNEKFQVESGHDPNTLIQFLEDKLYEFNSAITHKDDGRLFARIIRDENKSIIAGIAGWTWAGVCEVTQLWVDEKNRNQDFGTLLLSAAEDEAKKQGCLKVLIKTYSFQASGFYLKSGYQIEHTIVDFPIDYNYCIMSKKIG